MMVKFDQIIATTNEIMLDLRTLDENIREMLRIINSHLSTTMYCNNHYCYQRSSTDYFANKDTILQTSKVISMYGATIVRIKCFINNQHKLPIFHNKKITWREDGKFTYPDEHGDKLVKRECLEKTSYCPDYLHDVTPLDLLKGLHLISKGPKVYCQALKSIVVIDAKNKTTVCKLQPCLVLPPIFIPVLNFTVSPSHIYSLSDVSIPDHMSLTGLSSILIENKDNRKATTSTLFDLWSLSHSALSSLTPILPHKYTALVSAIVTLVIVSIQGVPQKIIPCLEGCSTPKF